MTNVFEIIAQKLIDLGVYDFLFPFIITSAIFYGLLKKTKILGESVTINGVLALSIAFLIFGFPKLIGVTLASPFSRFFTGVTVWILIIGTGVLLAGFFYPDLLKFLAEAFTRRTALIVMIVIGISLFITSGFITVFTGGWTPTAPGAPGPGISTDVIILAAAIIIFIVLLIIAGAIVGVK
jgi:hypothetical protein